MNKKVCTLQNPLFVVHLLCHSMSQRRLFKDLGLNQTSATLRELGKEKTC